MTAPRSDADAIRAWLDEKDALASKATSAGRECRWGAQAAAHGDMLLSLPVALAMVRVLMEAALHISRYQCADFECACCHEDKCYSDDALARVRRIAEGGQ